MVHLELAVSQCSTIALNGLLMNLEELPELFSLFETLLRILLVNNESGHSDRSLPLKSQLAAT